MGGGIVRTRGLKERNDATCPVCQSVKREPCRRLLKGGRLGGYQAKMHPERVNAPKQQANAITLKWRRG